MSTSSRKRQSPRLWRWTVAEDALLGSQPDRAIALRLGRTVSAVKTRRQVKGIIKRRLWTPQMDELLGTRPDRQVAQLIGCSANTVSARRSSLGIPCCYLYPRWTPEHLALLGKKPDEEVARLTGHPLNAVRHRRELLHRPPPAPALRYWTVEQERRLGTLPDSEVAALMGRSPSAVQGRRQKLKIKEVKTRLTAEELAFKVSANLLRQIDEVVGGLGESDRVLLARRFGLAGQAPLSPVVIAQQDGVTRSCIWFRLKRILRRICRHEGLRLQSLPDGADRISPRGDHPLRSVPVLTAPQPAASLQYQPSFYVKVIAGLRARVEPTLAELRSDLRYRLRQRRLRETASNSLSGNASRPHAPRSAPDPGADSPGAAGPPLSYPHDYIIIPEPLKTKTIASLGPSLGMPRLRKAVLARLRHLLQYAGIQRLGDLDGKRLSDFAEYRGSGMLTVRALGTMILRALYPGVSLEWSRKPIPMWAYQLLPRTIRVARGNRPLRLDDLPVSPELRRLLEHTDVHLLGQLHGMSGRALFAQPAFGTDALVELDALLRRVEAGEFTLSKAELASQTPADLLQLIDNLVSRLPGRLRTIVRHHLGASGRVPRTFRELGQQQGITRSRVRQLLGKAIICLRRQGGPRLQALIECAGAACVRTQAPLSPALVCSWHDPSRPFRYCPQFYVRLIPRLRSRERANPNPAARATTLRGEAGRLHHQGLH